MTTPREPREESSSTAQTSESAEVSPGKRPITFVRRRSSRFGADDGGLTSSRGERLLAIRVQRSS